MARPLDELKTIYATQPSVRDVVVEGTTDRNFLAWYLWRAGVAARFQIYPIDVRAEVDAPMVISKGEFVGCKGRIAAFAGEYESWDLSTPSLTCLVDSDYDTIDGVNRSYECLFSTRLPALENFALMDGAFVRFVHSTGNTVLATTAFRDSMLPAMNQLFAVRRTLIALGGMKLVGKIDRYLSDRSGSLALDADGLLFATLNSRGFAGRRDEAKAKLDATLDETRGLGLSGIHGHDVAIVVRHALGLSGRGADLPSIEERMRLSIEFDEVDTDPAFRALAARVQT